MDVMVDGTDGADLKVSFCSCNAALEVLMPLTEGGLQYLMAAARGNAEGPMVGQGSG